MGKQKRHWVKTYNRKVKGKSKKTRVEGHYAKDPKK